MTAERLRRLARGWDEVADGYEAYFVPRFAPWVTAAVEAASAAPPGPVLVPCCGTFPELKTLRRLLPGRETVGIDLSPGMIRLALKRAEGYGEVTALVGDASRLDPRWTGACAAVISVFGLQQLPDPVTAIGAWTEALRPGGVLSVVYWPSVTETEGPFALLGSVLPRPAEPDPWEDRLVASIASHGAIVTRDEHPAFPMSHPDAATFFDAYHRCGPMRSLALARGEEAVSRLRDEFLRLAPSEEWRHRPRARHLVAHKE